MTIESVTQARLVWQEPSGNQGHGAWLAADLARAVAQTWKNDEPRRTIFVEHRSGYRESVEVSARRMA